MEQVEEIRLLNPKEVSEETGVGLNTVYEWFRRKDFPKVPDDRINRISKRALNFWLMKIDYNQIVREAVEKEVKKDFRRWCKKQFKTEQKNANKKIKNINKKWKIKK